MMAVPLRCVIDTNVAVTANGVNEQASADCVYKSAYALQEVMRAGHVFIDDKGLIVQEYARNLNRKGEPGPGDRFFKWLLTVEWGGAQVSHVPITPKAGDEEDYEELPAPSQGTRYDPSDRKFLAVAAAHPEHPPILQAFDSKWWGWREALAAIGVKVCFLCPKEIAEKYEQKMGPS